jgi:ATP-dependent Lon protease
MAETDKDDLISIIEEDIGDVDIPTTLPLLPVRDVVIFTDMLLPLFVGREKSIRAVESAIADERFLFVVTQKDPAIENPKAEDIFRVGTISRILRMLKLPDGRVKVLVQGFAKARIKHYTQKRAYYRVSVEIMEEPEESAAGDLKLEALMRNVRDYSEKILALRGEFSGDVGNILDSIDEPGKLADLVASNLRLKIEEAQQIIELIDPVDRLRKVHDLLSRELEFGHAGQNSIQCQR